MSADPRIRHAKAAGALVAAVALCLCPLDRARPQDAPTPVVAIEQARALERQGFLGEARLYLLDLMRANEALGDDPDVLLEVARLTPDADEALQYIDSAISRTRDARLLTQAHRWRGDFLFMQGRYAEAALEYERGARFGDAAASDALGLRRAASLLSAADASRAADAYRALAEKGNAPEEHAPWAELGLARALLVGGDLEQAAIQFERTAEEHGEHDVRPHALAGAVECHAAAGSDSAAHAALSVLEAEYPETFEAILARDLLERVTAARDTTAVEDGGEAAASASE